MAPVKIVAFGDIFGQLPAFFQKLATLQAKHNFSFAIVAGNLFADPQTTTPEQERNVQDLIDGQIKVPVTTYFNLGSHALPPAVVEKIDTSDYEVCPNLYFLGRANTLTTSDKVRIVNLGGTAVPEGTDPEVTKDKYYPNFLPANASALKGAGSADILITSQWPTAIRTGSKKTFDVDAEPSSSAAIAELCAVLKPKYHISVSPDMYYEREPFFHPTAEGESSDAFQITRFISLAAFGNEKKSKSVLAFNFDPAAAPPVTLDPGITTSPLLSPGRKRQPAQDDHYSRFSDQNGMGGDRKYAHPRHKRRRYLHDPLADQQHCFFCMSNPNIAAHIIVDIGTRAYITLARGPLTTASTFPALGCPAHVLIIPIDHAPTLAQIEPAERGPAIAEMHAWRAGLNAMLAAVAPGLASVTWEVSRASIRHTHWQFLPVPKDFAQRGLLEAAFKVEAENEKYPPFEPRQPADDEKADFFRVIVWDPDAELAKRDKHLLMPIDESVRFDIQFGRKVMAKLLQLEGREDWRDCDQPVEAEAADTAKLKELFAPFAPKV